MCHRSSVGKVMAEWILEGEPSLDLWHMDIRRFGPHYRSPGYTLKRTREVYETYYDIRYPGHEREAGRPLRVSSAYEWHRAPGPATSSFAKEDSSKRPAVSRVARCSASIAGDHSIPAQPSGRSD